MCSSGSTITNKVMTHSDLRLSRFKFHFSSSKSEKEDKVRHSYITSVILIKMNGDTQPGGVHIISSATQV